MGDILSFLYSNRNGILILFLILFGIGGLVNYFLWILGKGRFDGASDVPKEKKLNFVITEAAFKLINDFRHLLALILVLVFSAILGYAVYTSDEHGTSLKDSLQAVMATLGGLVGSIIGYYFGEARGSSSSNSPPLPPTPPIQTTSPSPGSGGTTGPIVEAPKPPSE